MSSENLICLLHAHKNAETCAAACTALCMFYSFLKSIVKPVLSGHSKRRPKFGFHDRLSLNAGQKYCRLLQGEHSAILSTFIKLPFVNKISLVYFDWPLKTGFTVY